MVNIETLLSGITTFLGIISVAGGIITYFTEFTNVALSFLVSILLFYIVVIIFFTIIFKEVIKKWDI